MVGPPVEYSDAETNITKPPPMLGEHTDEILKEILGYNQATIDDLKMQHIIQ